MSDTSQEESFISHLVELRDRLLRSLIAIAIVFGALAMLAALGMLSVPT